MILAAGGGSRLGHLGDDRPKCFVELEGRPLIERQIAALRRRGVSEIGVVRGYRAEMIDFPGLTYFSNPRWAESNIVMSLAAAAPWLRVGPVIVSYADIFYRNQLVQGLPGARRLVITYDRDWRRLGRAFCRSFGDAETFRSMPEADCSKLAVKRRGSRISKDNIWDAEVHAVSMERHRRFA